MRSPDCGQSSRKSSCSSSPAAAKSLACMAAQNWPTSSLAGLACIFARAQIERPIALPLAVALGDGPQLGAAEAAAGRVDPAGGPRHALLEDGVGGEVQPLHASQAAQQDEVRRPLANALDAPQPDQHFLISCPSQKGFVYPSEGDGYRAEILGLALMLDERGQLAGRHGRQRGGLRSEERRVG